MERPNNSSRSVLLIVVYVHKNYNSLLGTGRKGEGAWRWGKREIIYISLHCHHQNYYRYTVTTRMTCVLRWAAMRAILMFH